MIRLFLFFCDTTCGTGGSVFSLFFVLSSSQLSVFCCLGACEMAHELESGTGKLIRPAYARRKQPTSSLMADAHTTPALTELDHAEISVDSGGASASEHKTLLPHKAMSSSLGRHARTAMHGLFAVLGVVAVVMACLAVDKHVSHIFLAADPPSDNSGGGTATLAAVQSQEFVKRVATALLQTGNDTNALVPLLVAGFLQPQYDPASGIFRRWRQYE
jgi:hypothetical protein